MLVQRIVGVLCCLALCGCLWQPPRYVPPPPPSPVIQAKDYVVPWPEVSWGAPPIDVRFVFPENEKEFPREMYARLEQRQLLRPVMKMSKDAVDINLTDIKIGHKNVLHEKESLYYRPSINAELMQFDRIHFSFVMTMNAKIVVKRYGKILFTGIFQADVPDGQIYCINFGEIRRFPRVAETIYLWPGVEKLCLTRKNVSEFNVVLKKMAEIFAGDMEELIIGLMKP